MSELFELFKAADYHFGSCSVRVYDRKLGPDDFLLQLYRSSLPRLASTFCGMTDLSSAAICAYLSTRSPLLLACADNPGMPGGLEVIGYSFPTIWAGPRMGSIDPDPGRSMFLGYTFFKPWWGKPEISVCMMLTGIYYFHEFGLLSIGGQRLECNRLTSKFLSQFGVVDTGYIPDFLMHGGKMVKCCLSSLSRSDFESYVRHTLSECSQI